MTRARDVGRDSLMARRSICLALLLLLAIAGCGTGPVDRTDIAAEYRALGLDFDERELSDGRDAYTSDLSGHDPFVEIIGDPVAEMSLVLFDVDGADFESEDFELADYVTPADALVPDLAKWIVERFDEHGAGDWSDTSASGPWKLEAEFTDDWLTTGVSALDMHFELESDE
jgi:hypothetical protein